MLTAEMIIQGAAMADDGEDTRRYQTAQVNARALRAIDEIKELTVKMNAALDTLEHTVSLTKKEWG